MQKVMLILPVLFLIASGCVDDSVESRIRHKGVVLGKIRSAGGGMAISMTDSTFSNHKWRGFNNVVEALNIQLDQYKPGDKIYFIARRATIEEQFFVTTADGDESEKPTIFVEQVSTSKCTITN